MPLGASEAELQQFDLIRGPFDLLAVQAHMHRVPQIQAHHGQDDQHAVLLAEFPELEPADQGLVPANTGNMDHIDRLHGIGLDRLNHGG